MNCSFIHEVLWPWKQQQQQLFFCIYQIAHVGNAFIFFCVHVCLHSILHMWGQRISYAVGFLLLPYHVCVGTRDKFKLSSILTCTVISLTGSLFFLNSFPIGFYQLFLITLDWTLGKMLSWALMFAEVFQQYVQVVWWPYYSIRTKCHYALLRAGWGSLDVGWILHWGT